MKSWAKWTARTVLVTTGFAAAGGGFADVAFAGTPGTHAGNVSVLSGNRVSIPVSIPIEVCGNAVAVLGIATAACQGGASVASGGWGGSGGSWSSDPSAGSVAAGHGNVVRMPIEAAVDACGNAFGTSSATCHGGVHLPAGGSGWIWSASGGGTWKRASLSAGNLSAGSGNDVQIPVSIPVDVCGNAAAVLGDASAGCVGGATVGGHADRAAQATLPQSAPSVTQLARLGALPGVASLPALGGLTTLPVLDSLTNGKTILPASTLSSLQEGSGMSGNSFATLAIGALLAGAAALKLATRRLRTRTANAGEASA